MTTAPDRLLPSSIRICALPNREFLAGFMCGEREIDTWVRDSAWPLQKALRKRVFCAALDHQAARAVGFYALSMTVEESKKTNADKRFTRDSHVPLIYVDYLGVIRPLQNQGIGTLLLMNALDRAVRISEHVAIYGVALRSLNENTTALYERFGFKVMDAAEKQPLMVLDIWSLRDLGLAGSRIDPTP